LLLSGSEITSGSKDTEPTNRRCILAIASGPTDPGFATRDRAALRDCWVAGFLTVRSAAAPNSGGAENDRDHQTRARHRPSLSRRFGREATVYASDVTREQAESECERLAAESPDRATHSWLPRGEADGSWSVVKVHVPPADRSELTAETRADERPPTGDDPRPGMLRNIPPYG
jgi:hypothetical protein